MAGLLACGANLRAQTTLLTWTGTGNATLGATDPANWIGGNLTANSGADVQFGLASPPTVNFPASESVGNVTFVNTGTTPRPTYTFSGQNSSTLTLGGNITVNTSGSTTASGSVTVSNSLKVGLSSGAHTINVANSGTTPATTLALGSNIVETGGSASIVKSGSGILTLSGTDTYTGATTISAGTVQFAKQVSLYNNTAGNWTAANLVVGSGATAAFNVGGSGEFTAANITTLVALGGASNGFTNGSCVGLDTTNAGGNFTYSGVIANPNGGANALGLTKLGSGTLTLSGTNTYTGTTTISAGTLQLGAGGTTGSVAGNIVDNGTLVFDRSNTAIYAGSISGTGGVSVISPTANETQHPTVVLRGTNTFAGNVNIVDSSIILDSTGALPSGAPVVLGDDAYLGYTENGFDNFTLFKNAIVSAGSSHNGDTIIGLDSANLASPRAINDTIDLSSLGSVYLGTATNITLNGPIISPAGNHLYLTGVAGGYLKITSSLTPANSVTSVSVGSSESEPGDVSYQGYVELTNATSNYTGGTIFQSGYLLIGNSSVTSSGAITAGPLGTGTLTVNGTADTGAPALAASVSGVTLNNKIVLSTTLQVGVPATSTSTDFAFPIQPFGNNSITLAGIISGSGALTVNGGGTLTLTGADNYSGGTTIKSGTLQIGAGGTVGSITGSVVDNSALSFNRSDSPSFAGVISGSGAVSQIGGGVLTLSGANTYTGATSVKAGILSVSSLANGGSGSGLGASTNAAANLVVDGGVLQYTGPAQGTDRLFTIGANGSGIDASGTGALTFTNPGSVAITGTNTTTIFSLTGNSTANNTLTPSLGNSGAGTTSLAKTGAGTWVLAGVNTYTGSTNVSGGTLRLGVANALSAATDVNLSLGSALLDLNGFGDTVGSIAGAQNTNITLGSGTLATADNNSTIFAGVISGTGGLTKGGTGTLTLGGVNTYTGPTTVNAGTLQIGGMLSSATDLSLPIAGASVIFTNGGTVNSISGVAGTMLGISAGGGLTTSGSSTTTFAGSITGGSLTKAGPGTLTLAGTNTYNGGTIINAGTLALSAAGSIATGADVAIASGATFSVGNNQTIRGLSGAGTVQIADNTTLTANLPTINGSGTGGASGTSTFGGSLTGNGTATLAEAGAGSLTLNGASPSFAGPIVVNSGTLIVSSPGALGATTAGTTVANPGTLIINNVAVGAEPIALNGNGASNGGALVGTGAASLAGPVTLNANSTIGTVAPSDVFTLSGAIGESGGSRSLTTTGTGTVTLAGQSTYTGNTTINQGTLVIGTTNALPASTSLNISGTLDVAANQTVAGFNSSAFNSVIMLEGGATLDIALGNPTHNTIFSGNITNGNTAGGALEIGNGNGFAVYLTGTNTFSGGTTIDAGGTVLLGGNNGATGSLAGNVVDNGSLIFGRGNAMTFGGVISGTGSVSQGVGVSTTGTTTLTAANNYSGGTTVNGGTLVLANPTGSATGNGDVTVAAGATLQVGNGGTSGSLTGNISNSGTTIYNRSDSSVVYGGILSGSGTFVKQGSGSLMLTGTSTYAGASSTKVAAGTLIIGATNALPTATQIALATSSTLEVAGNQTIAGFFGNNSAGSTLLIDPSKTLTVAMPVADTFTTFAGNVNGSGNFTASGQGGDFVNLTGTVTAPIVQGVGATIVTGSNPITLSAPLLFSGNTTQTLNNVISGGTITNPVTLTFSAGNTTFTASNTYVGSTVITGGKLVVNNPSGSATGTGTVTVSNGGTLGGSGFISGPLVLASGGTISPGNSPGTLSVGPTTWAGGATFAFDINNAGTAVAPGTPGTNWDLLNITGGLTIAATQANPFIVTPTSLTLSNAAGLVSNFDPTQAYSWDFVTTTTGISVVNGAGNAFNSNLFSINTSAFQNSLGIGSFFVSQTGNNLFLNFTPVPEPSTWLLLACGTSALAAGALRRRAKR